MSRAAVCCVLALALVILCEDVAAKKKSKKKQRTKDSGHEKVVEPTPGHKRVRSPREWNTMSSKEWWDIEEEAEDPDTKWKPPHPEEAPTGADFDPNNPDPFLRATQRGKPAMLFAKVRPDRHKRELEELAFKWKSLLVTNGIECMPYVVEDSKILFYCEDGTKGWDVKAFLLEQPELEQFEWDGRVYPSTKEL
mmetsp:Transcript_30175/g.70997  ORF Transcript_30175/g.70997 Transcript_30175/m.70997 type:complete len:194 (+) Transcript_30175:14-595(+)